MKQKVIMVVFAALLLGIFSVVLISIFQKPFNTNIVLENERMTKTNGAQDLDYSAETLPKDVVESLNLAISDEYKAQTTYAGVLEKFGSIRPFSMIVKAEEQHISQLKSLYDKYGVEIPENTWEGSVQIPETVKEACEVGIVAEIENVNLYKDKLLPTVTEYSDITSVFTNLMNASQNKHLPAFEKCR